MAGTNYLAGFHMNFASVFLDLWPLWILLLIVILIRLVFKLLEDVVSIPRTLWEKQRLAKSGIAEIDMMGGKTFEKYLEVLFEKLGYRVERTRYIGDYGADLVAAKDGVKTVIQAKRHKSKVGVKAIQEAVAAKGYYECEEAMVVTNSYYTEQAIELAKSNQVELWDRDDLVDALLSVKKESSGTVNEAARNKAVATNDQPTEAPKNSCAFCGKPVSDKVVQYCMAHQERFSGKIYCYEHQKALRIL